MTKSFSSYQSWIIAVGVILFGIMGYFGYRFITEAERSASGIQSHIEPRKELNLKELESSSPAYTLDKISPLNASDNTPNEEISVSSGQDIQIEKGEFSYIGGQPKVQLVLKNTGQLAVDFLHINLNLLLNQEKKSVAQAQAIEIKLPQTLLEGETVKIDVPIAGEAWTAEAVAQAEKRRIQAKIISVSMADGQDYPQNSGSVVLSQVANDWVLPDAPSSSFNQENIEEKESVIPNQSHEQPIQTTPEPNHQERESAPPNEQDVQALKNDEMPEEVRRAFFGEDKLPEKNEVGVISHEYKEFQK